jgi:glyoxylase-like metal-dependent hydrolase (beta-lactamase superfamily II)
VTLSPRPSDPSAIRTDDPLALSSRVLDSGRADEPTNRVSNRLSELDDGLSIVESFSHVYTFDTGDGLVCFDASGAGTGAAAVGELRRWRTDRVHTLVYTHGHVDHVGGSGAIAADAAERRLPGPAVVGHERVVDRFHRYRATNGYNLASSCRSTPCGPR